MHIVMFYHSLLSDWNHGNAHFLRGFATELISRGHSVEVFEPADSWSLENMRAQHGEEPVQQFHRAYPDLRSRQYNLATLDLDEALDKADLVIVHEWSAHSLVRRIGHHRAHNDYVLLFHDTHHRMVTQPESMAAYDLSEYDGVLAYGEVLRELYEVRQNVRRAFTWHEAADTKVFRPLPRLNQAKKRSLIWIGNWGDDERTAELQEFLIEPVKDLGIEGRVFGVRYPSHARDALRQAALEYGGWLANFDVPGEFARSRFTVHVPRRPYVKALPGIPTIRPFEAMACGIPLITSPWNDSEGLFRPGKDYLIARNGREMKEHMRAILNDSELSASLTASGLETIMRRHTCGHRVDELLQIHTTLAGTKLQSPNAVQAAEVIA